MMNVFDKLKNLRDGWDGYSAEAPSSVAIANAQSLVVEAANLGMSPSRVAPSAMGGVAITFKEWPKKVFVEFYNGGTTHALFSDRSSGEMKTLPVPTDSPGYLHLLGCVRDYLFDAV